MSACSSSSWRSGCSANIAARLRSLPICHYWLLIQCRKLEVKRALQDRKVHLEKKSDKQKLSLPNPSPFSFSNYYPPFQSSAWSNEYTPQPPQFGPCPVGFPFQSPVYAQCVDMYSNCQLAPSYTNPTEWFRLQSLEGTRIHMCYGCNSPICTDSTTVSSPPHDMVIAYEERRWYQDPHTQWNLHPLQKYYHFKVEVWQLF